MTAPGDTTTYVALLRGVNVGGNRKVPMAQLRDCLAALGFTDVRTYLQSGNAVFGATSAPTGEIAARIEEALRQRFGFDVPTVVWTGAELAKVVAGNPYPEVESEPTKLVVSFLSGPVPPEVAAAFDLSDLPERGQVGDRVVYLHYPDGQGVSKLVPAMLERRLGRVWGTARNWRTVTALLALASD
ncbi:MAG TPA: DUF1697 domain-containing protein [Candidatus Nanopelagicales bacterium]